MEGFALIDVLVGLALVSVISALMIVFLGQARTMMRISKATQMQTEVDAATRFLEVTLSNAEALPLAQSTPDDVIYFSGEADRLRFNGIMAIGFGSAALREVTILPTGDGRLSIVQNLRRGSSAGGEAESRTVPLIGGVTGVRFEYLDGSKGTWSVDWKTNRRLPSAVRFRISVARDGAIYASDGFARLSLASLGARR
ncbi:general secretion pathway protein GspJ [Mesorhizobium sp. B2-3-5]|nr:general secretion pathway protein GspJ [Mesorhizobium sp. B2-3-5]